MPNSLKDTIVLLKNDGILPLSLDAKYNVCNGNNAEKQDKKSSDYLNKLVSISANNDCTIFYLGDESTTKISRGQLKIYNALIAGGATVVVIITSTLLEDFSFVGKASALFLFGSEVSEDRGLDALYGRRNPTSKLLADFGPYPFGYGLSYARIVYSSFKVNQDGISFRIRNDSSYNVVEMTRLFATDKKEKVDCGYAVTNLSAGQEKDEKIYFTNNLLADYVDSTRRVKVFSSSGTTVFACDIETSNVIISPVKKIEPVKKRVLVDDTYNLKKLVDNLLDFTGKSGLNVDRITICSILAGMAAARAIFITHNDLACLKKLVETISIFFGGSGAIFDNPKLYDEYGHSKDLLNELYSSNDEKIHILPFEYKNVDLDDLKVFSYYLRNPRTNLEIDLGAYKNMSVEDMLKLGNNNWFFFIIDDDTAIDRNLKESGVVIDANMKIVFNNKMDQPQTLFYYNQFISHLQMAISDCFIQDKYWDNLAKLERFLENSINYHFYNKLWKSLERYTSMYAGLTLNETEAVDTAIAFKILPVVAFLNKQNTFSDGESLLGFLERIFGVNELKKCEEILSK